MQVLIDAHISHSYRDMDNLTLRGVARKFGISVEVMGKLYPAGARLAYVALSGKAASFTSFPQPKHFTASPYLLVLLAIKRHRYNICHKLTPDHVSTFGVHLRELPGKSLTCLTGAKLLNTLQTMRKEFCCGAGCCRSSKT